MILSKKRILLLLSLLVSLSAAHGHHHHSKSIPAAPIESCSCPVAPPTTHLSDCDFVIRLSSQKAAVGSDPLAGKRQKAIFSTLFPFENPGWNALLGTFYVSSFPNLILAFIPSDISGSTLNTMIAFSTGGLLGDVFLHLIPETFLSSPNVQNSLEAEFIMVEEKRNVILGLALFFGYAAFFLLEKGMRILNGEGGGHDHNHSHSHNHDTCKISAGSEKSSTELEKEKLELKKLEKSKPASSLRLAAYMNLISDMSHNFTDGIALAASFYASPAIGATTTVAVFMHEIPHELSDYSLLLASGFTRKQAFLSQTITAIGAFLGTLLGILLHYLNPPILSTESTYSLAIQNVAPGLLGTSVTLANCVIPFTAGSFIYIATTGVVPSLLNDTKQKDWSQGLREVAAMVIGVGLMAGLSWNE